MYYFGKVQMFKRLINSPCKGKPHVALDVAIEAYKDGGLNDKSTFSHLTSVLG